MRPPEPISAESLALPRVRHAFFTREGGVSTGIYASLNTGTGSADDQVAVAENLNRVASHMGVARDHLVMLFQTHSAIAHTVAGPSLDRPEGDAMVTAVPGIALGIRTADCAPVLFADERNGVVGAAHAGWRGAVGGILEATLAAMLGAGAEADHIVVAIGPTIAQPSYEVGPELRDSLASDTPRGIDTAPFFVPSQTEGRLMFDLPAYVTARLRHAGVGAVENLACDTYTDETRFYSYRRRTHRKEAGQGSLLSAISLEA
ncbi:peptidoglycan editing factor PgeF [Acuticoccus sediminis]|uniref:Purine nucleoside phosphorylase n=1 Tax=Acuticoccus sediminis TaxID=2184697 RepID=A0A8B2NKN3_9HYPH|nr:peptidoglycan editing factor PgeF [Acuticoccus sediminis]